jgi:hypothetical protein
MGKWKRREVGKKWNERCERGRKKREGREATHAPTSKLFLGL